MKRIFIFLFLLLFISIGQAQFNSGACFKSQYVIKGIQLCATPTIGGYLEYSTKNFIANITADASISERFSENTVTFAWSLVNDGSIWLCDYYYPYPANKYGNFANKNLGAHFIEIGGRYNYAGFEFMATGNVYNDTTHSKYLQINRIIRLPAESGQLSFFIGAAIGKAFFYNTEKGLHVINVGMSHQYKKLVVTYYVNPTAEESSVIVTYNL
jgi:hypothetical protein